MPYLQNWIDPNTGATFPQSYVRVEGQPQVDFVSQRVSFAAARYASAQCYSLGFHPLERRDITVAGAAYAANFGPQVSAAQGSFNVMLAQTTDSYIGTVTTMSGATPTP